jgi:predicted ATPase with chaperone activity
MEADNGMTEPEPILNAVDLESGDVRGLETAERAFTVTATGGHNALMM